MQTLPRRGTPFLWPNAQDMSNLPRDADENPTAHASQQGLTPAVLPAANATTFTQAVYPKLMIPFERLVANLDKALLKQVEECLGNFLAVLPFSAGSKLYVNSPSINIHILNFLIMLGIQDTPASLQLAKARWRAKLRGKSDFQTPWSLILSGLSRDLKLYLLWQQTFAVDKNVSVIPFDKSL